MVVPLALGAQNGKVKVRIHSSDRDVKAVHLLRGAVGVGDGICGGLQPVGLVVGGIGSLAQIQVDDMGGSKADMEGHLAVLHGQGALAVAGFVGVEHAAVGVKLGGIHTIRQSGGLSSRRSHGRSSLRAGSTVPEMEVAQFVLPEELSAAWKDAVEEAPQPTSRLSAREAATTQEKTRFIGNTSTL